LRENDKVKEDALAHLSNQLLVLSERIYTTVRKKTIGIILSKLIEKKDLLVSIQKPIRI
jgi:hypothetical protein